MGGQCMLGWICGKIKAGRLIDWQIGSSEVAIDWANSQFLTSSTLGESISLIQWERKQMRWLVLYFWCHLSSFVVNESRIFLK